MTKPIYLNTEIYTLILESLVNQTDEDILKYSKKEGRVDGIKHILENPSWYLLNICKIFNKPEILNKVIFDIDDLEYMFDQQSIEDIKEDKEEIAVKRVVDNLDTKLTLSSIKKAFEDGCTIDGTDK